MLNINNHPFHIVDHSPWPVKISLAIINIIMSIVQIIIKKKRIIILSIISIIVISFQWWRDVSREASFQGLHSTSTIKNIKLGIMLFIISEVIFFLSFFWIFTHISLRVETELGIIWPPKNSKPFNPLEIPLLNTIILLLSGITITKAHIIIIKKTNIKPYIIITLTLGIYFTIIQIIEYKMSPYTFQDSSFGSSFYISTGFHGLHVIVGSIIIITSTIRTKKNHFNKIHHFGFEATAWYWHFVDVVWIILYTIIYAWTF